VHELSLARISLVRHSALRHSYAKLRFVFRNPATVLHRARFDRRARKLNIAEEAWMPGPCGKGICHLPSPRHPLLGLVCASKVAGVFESRKLTYQRVSSTSA
jgi:hypothetical protein